MDAGKDFFEFGRFRLDRTTRVLSENGKPIAISSRAFDILHFLILNRDRIVTKDEIISRVWQGMIVDENNLAVQISSLRRALFDHDETAPLILTVPGRGYRFVGKLAEAQQPAPQAGRTRSRVWLAAVGLVVFLAAGYLAYRTIPSFGGHAAKPAPRLSIVVMPFRNLGEDASDAYLADAVSDDLTTDLSHIPESTVIARTSADTYKGRSVSAAQVGQELGVRYLLEGSLRRTGDRFQINAQLIDTQNGTHLWADRFDVSRQTLVDAQTAIVRHIASALNFTLVQIEGQRSMQDRPNDPDAVDHFFRARSLLEREDNLDTLVTAQGMLEKSLQLQPNFVDAMSELAWLLLHKVAYFDDPTDAQDMEAVRKLIPRALGLAPQNARVLAARGFLLKLDGKCKEAIASNQLALNYDPNNIDALTGIAVCTANLGNPEEADRRLKELLKLDPQDPNNKVRYNQLGLVNLMLGRNDEAIDWFQKSMAADPNGTESADSLNRTEFNELGLMAAYGLTGRLQEAQARYVDYSRRAPRRTVWRIQSYFSKAEANLPGFRAAMASLKQVGMPEYADEKTDFRVVAVREPKSAGDFDPTPVTIPGANVVTTSGLSEMMSEEPGLTIIDVGRGAAVISNAHWIGGQAFPSESGNADLQRVAQKETGEITGKRIVVMGTGPYEWYAYNAALTLVSIGYQNVWWYRGGEEAWAASGMKSEDLRDP
jgi:TolB-like protein/DNA-binding winged helix-turn-helix (wHTH) protein/cytochrome c-type biogenesis protein CcmH/NrfG/rhodanese-related sulfurtransferase